MGPQLDSCGRQEQDQATLILLLLQWGRNLIVAEGRVSQTEYGAAMMLQWGRNLIVAEGFVGDPPVPRLYLLQWGRNLIVAEGLNGRQRRVGPTASMGPQLDSCGRYLSFHFLGTGFGASMGPQLDSCGRLAAPVALDTPGTLQWGRNLIVAEGTSTSARSPSLPGFNGAAT